MGNLLFCGRLSVPSSTRQTTLRIVIVGLDGAGKTTVFKWLTSAESLASGPTIGEKNSGEALQFCRSLVEELAPCRAAPRASCSFDCRSIPLSTR